MNQPSTFEDRLLADLLPLVDARADRRAPSPRPTRVRSRARGRVLLVGGLVAAATGAFLVMPRLGAEPAYSVSDRNGEVQVRVNRPEDAAGLEQALAEHGIKADITYLPWGTWCQSGRYQEAAGGERRGVSISIGLERLQVTIDQGVLRNDETFVLMVGTRERVGDQGEQIMDGRVESAVAAGDVTQCLPEPG